MSPDNHRVRHGDLAGPLSDIGAYPLNAFCNLSGTEPFALASRAPDRKLGDLDGTIAVTLRFPGDRSARFTVGDVGSSMTYTVVGSAGSVQMEPAFVFGKPLDHTLKVGEKQTT